MIQAKLYQIPCPETGKFALHAEQITVGPDERQLGNSSRGLELGLSLAELAREGKGQPGTERPPDLPSPAQAAGGASSTRDPEAQRGWAGRCRTLAQGAGDLGLNPASATSQWCNRKSVPPLLCLTLHR